MNIIKITDMSLKELDIYARYSENQLRTINEPDCGIFIAESPIVIERALNAGYTPISILAEDGQLREYENSLIGRCGNIPVFTAPSEILSGLTGFKLTRGILCAMHRKRLEEPEVLLYNKNRIAVLENVVSPTNIGAIIRSAAALGIDAVLLSDGCSDPLYRRAIRVSMGTVFQIPWTFAGKDYMNILKKHSFKTAAMALCDDSVGIDDERIMKEEKLAVILGTEGEGLKKETIAACDYAVKIPMYHNVDSLNVAAASAVAFWQLRKEVQL